MKRARAIEARALFIARQGGNGEPRTVNRRRQAPRQMFRVLEGIPRNRVLWHAVALRFPRYGLTPPIPMATMGPHSRGSLEEGQEAIHHRLEVGCCSRPRRPAPTPAHWSGDERDDGFLARCLLEPRKRTTTSSNGPSLFAPPAGGAFSVFSTRSSVSNIHLGAGAADNR